MLITTHALRKPDLVVFCQNPALFRKSLNAIGAVSVTMEGQCEGAGSPNRSKFRADN
jgi:hypothetical protein